MATYTIVDKDKDPLDPGEINAGVDIDFSAGYNDGDIFIIDPSANATTKFEAASSVSFEVRFDSSNANGFDLDFNANTNPDVTIAAGVNISDVKIDAAGAETIALTAGNNVSLKEFVGSDGADTITIGDGFSTFANFDTGNGSDTVEIGANADFNNHDILLRQGDNSLSVGPGLQAKDIKADDGVNTIDIGDGAVFEDIAVGDGDNVITLGDNVAAVDISTGNGDNTITIGNGLSMNNLDTGDGADTIVIGDDAVINDLKSHKGNDSITIGDSFVIDKLEAGDGDDFVRLGDGGTFVGNLDGGNGNDRLSNGGEYDDIDQNFENVVCFAAGTFIETTDGPRPVETLAPGDLVFTLDNGPQPIRWLGKSVVSERNLTDRPSLRPIRIKAGAIGDGLPTSDLIVSPQHRILIRSKIAWRMFGKSEVLAAAKQFLSLPGFEVAEDLAGVTYVHILCDQHEIVYSNGAESETLHLGPQAFKTLSREAQAEVNDLFPELFGSLDRPASRYLVQGRLARNLAERHRKNDRELLTASHDGRS